MTRYEYEVRQAMKRKGYVISDFEPNLIGIRKDRFYNNQFDDTFCILHNSTFFVCDCTTDPGMYYVENFENPRGVAVLKPGQYLQSHRLGVHKGQYEALVQARSLTVYRDNNKDKVINYVTPDTGMFGINIHRASASGRSVRVDRWSAGCTVIADSSDFKRVLTRFKEIQTTVQESMGLRPTYGTYTLLEEIDLIGSKKS